jgi:hypothetical protein
MWSRYKSKGARNTQRKEKKPIKKCNNTKLLLWIFFPHIRVVEMLNENRQ